MTPIELVTRASVAADSGAAPTSYRRSLWDGLLLSTILSLLAVGCESGDGVPHQDARFFDHGDFAVTTINGELLSDAPAIGQPDVLQLSGNVLWVGDGASDPGLHALNARTGELLLSTGRRGEGPGEFSTAPFSLVVAPGDTGAVWTWDPGLQRLTRFEPRIRADDGLAIVHVQETPALHRIAWIAPQRLVGQANSEEARFKLFAPDGHREQVVPGVLLGPDTARKGLRLNVTNSGIRLCAWPDRGFAIVNSLIGRIEYYDLEARLVRVARVPYPSEPEFGVNELGQPAIIAPRYWYVSCTATRDHLYAVFSGRLTEAYEDEDKYSGEFMHILDWNGDLRLVLRFDRPIFATTVDPSGEALYASSLVDAGVYRYRLPPIARAARPTKS